MIERTGYRSELLAEGTIEALGRVENIDELVGVADEYRTLAEFLEAAVAGGRLRTSWTATAPPCRS